MSLVNVTPQKQQQHSPSSLENHSSRIGEGRTGGNVNEMAPTGVKKTCEK